SGKGLPGDRATTVEHLLRHDEVVPLPAQLSINADDETLKRPARVEGSTPNGKRMDHSAVPETLPQRKTDDQQAKNSAARPETRTLGKMDGRETDRHTDPSVTRPNEASGSGLALTQPAKSDAKTANSSGPVAQRDAPSTIETPQKDEAKRASGAGVS